PNKLLEIVDNTIPQDGNTKAIVDWLIAPISRLGLACYRKSASERMKMNEVLKELNYIKETCKIKFAEIIHT
uniref:Uncharacterized protein n=1 Tax=Oryza brachyantha TaxID=4533 RepID=J3N1V1_ORYBR